MTALRRYVVAVGFGNLAWEFAQLPLYTIWHEASPRENIFAALHCVAGDMLIASSALLSALLVAGDRRWPHARFPATTVIAVLGGLAYAVFSEWLNTDVRGNWTYSKWMPTLPLIGSGLAPLAQWIVVPSLALWWVKRGAKSDDI